MVFIMDGAVFIVGGTVFAVGGATGSGYSSRTASLPPANRRPRYVFAAFG